uniref:Protein disulfide-isomerase A5 n=1 Tax=Neogobius melanostomus TaxID=47308 RepID=A0A8C6UCM5_9GOBI
MLLLLLLVWLLPLLDAVKVSPLIEKVSDHKDFKKLLRTRTNVLVLYTKSATSGESQLKLLSDVAQTVKGQGTIAWVNCGDSEGRKLCKKVKVDPGAKFGGFEMLHYKDGTFHMEYNRPATFKSMVAFLKDPSGPPLWEENPEAKDVLHVETEKDFRKLLKKEERPILMMFYAPCKSFTRSDFHSTSETKSGEHCFPKMRGVLAGMNVHPSEFDGLKQEYNVKGYPTFCYFEKGKFLHHYENYGATSKDIASDWLEGPAAKDPEVPWSESDSPVFHLTDESFDSFLEEHTAALIMFYAPWCGHCKKMKPEYDEAAEVLNKASDSPGVLAALDATVHKAAGDRFKISGFPTVKYFVNGEEKYTLPHLRSKEKIIEFMHNPQAPPPPEQSWEEKPSSVSHLGFEDFREALKKKKHALVMFYAPWCPHCKNAVPHFTTAAELFKEDRKIVYAAVDCTKGQNHELCKQEGVEGYPTFNHYNYGKFSERYNGDRGEAGFIGFMRSLRGRDQEKVVKKKDEL